MSQAREGVRQGVSHPFSPFREKGVVFGSRGEAFDGAVAVSDRTGEPLGWCAIGAL